MSNIGHNEAPDEEKATNWFAVSRDIFDHPIVGIHDRPFTDLEAWLWMLASASYETKKAINKGDIILLDPGDLMAAHAYLATRWMWTVGKVRHFLKRLETDAMIARYCASQSNNRRNNRIQIITICNYSKFRPSNIDQQQAKQQANNKPATAEQQANNKNLTNKQINKQTNIPPNPQRGDADDFPSHVQPITDWSEAYAQPEEGLLWGDDGSLRMVNGTLSYWLKMFGGDQTSLDLALVEAKAGIQPNSRQPRKAQIERKLAQIARQRIDQDKRYAKAAGKKAKSAKDVDIFAIMREMTGD